MVEKQIQEELKQARWDFFTEVLTDVAAFLIIGLMLVKAYCFAKYAGKRRPEQTDKIVTAMVIATQVGICVLLPLFVIYSFKSEKIIDRNFGETLHWQANAGVPIVLEAKREIKVARTASYDYYLYLHLHGKTFICRYDNEKFSRYSGAAAYLLYFYSKRKIELAEIKAAFARGERAPGKTCRDIVPSNICVSRTCPI